MRNNMKQKKLKKVQTSLIKEKKSKKNIYIAIICLVAVILIVFSIWYKKEKDVKVVELNDGKYEIFTETKGYVINNETVVKYETDETLIPVAESEKRVTINNVIGIYKNDKYEEDIKKLNKIDEQINEKIKVLPEVYSNDVISIDKEIDEVVKKTNGLSSYIEMSDYKTKLDNLAYKKALTISSLTPSGEEVKNLILDREKYKNNMNNSSNNVKAPLSGVMIYKNDGLEDKFEINDIEKLSKTTFENIIQEYDKTKEELFGLKIVDNYKSYILIKEDRTNDKYITEKKVYTIEILDKSKKIKGNLIKKIQDEDTNYCLFEINNNVEDIIDLRKTDVKVVWKELYGYIVNNNSIKKINDIDYVTVLSLNKYIDIPVKILLKLENSTLINNYTKDEKTKLNITETKTLQLYDRVVQNK